MNNEFNARDKDFTSLIYPTFGPCADLPTNLPNSFKCKALLHPFSPPPEHDPHPDVPFYQLCLANFWYIANYGISIQIIGENYGEWWYQVLHSGTLLSTDKGANWTRVDMGWTVPGTSWWGDATCVGNIPLNWMNAQNVNWYKKPVPGSNAATWFWVNSDAGTGHGLPVRMMFGQPPPSPVKGDTNQLAFFQMFSFTYLVEYSTSEFTELPDAWDRPSIDGFQFGNPMNYQKFIWNDNFGMTTFMTPVDEKSNPLPTRVLYIWKPDGQYHQLTDRAQNTLMYYIYNQGSPIVSEEALLFGVAPPGVPSPPHAGSGFLNDVHQSSPDSCKPLPFGQEPPDWTYISAVKGTIHANISNNIELCPHQNIMLVSVLFPPTPEYQQGRYLWTWYSPYPGTNGLHARPVTFMESASNIAEGGTSLALADYYSYQEFGSEWIPSIYFRIPAACNAIEGATESS